MRALVRSAMLVWRVRGQGRQVLLEYVRYGLMQKVKNQLLQQWRPGLSFR